MSKAVNSKWKKTFPDTIGNQNRPANGVDDTQPFETGGFPQYMANDPVRYDLQNAAMSQLMSNDARLKEMVDARGKELDDHKVDPDAHKTGIAGNAATATKVVTTAASGASANIAEATMASSDYARIRVSGNDNAGELALETADDGSEPIVARQYTGAYTNAVRTAKILDESGNTSFPGTVVAPKFTGALNGNAATATKLFTERKINITGNATGSAGFDGSGNVNINTTVNTINNQGDKTAIKDGTKEPAGLNLYKAYNNGYPASYGNLISIGGKGGGELLAEWSGTNCKIGHLYYRNRRDMASVWSEWSTIAFTTDINDYAPTKTGGGASGTWDINISGTATKLTTARTISLTGNASGSATFDGSNNISISTTVNESKHAAAADNSNKLASESGSNYLFINTEEDNWSVIGPNPGNWLKSIRTDVSAPPYSIGNYSTAIAFGGRDTKGIITHAYNSPDVKFAGGSGSTAGWKFTIHGGSNNEVYNLNDFPTKTGGGASGTWGIDISGNAASATNADKVDGYHASDLLGKIYPVGSIYMSMSATNPHDLFGVGTWKRISQGRMLLGADDSTYKAGATGGEATHTLTVNEIPAHSHGISTSGDHSHYFYGSNGNDGPLTEGDGLDTEANCHYTRNERFKTSSAGAHTHTISNSGGGAAHNNMSPYLVCYIWQRTA